MTLSSKCFVSQSDTICVDPMLLFSKAGYYSRKHFGELDTVLKQELCSYPPALFQNNDTLLSINRAALADAVNCMIPYDTLVVWPIGETYDALCSRYVQYVDKKDSVPIFVFDVD